MAFTELTEITLRIFILVLTFIISSLPLYFTIKILNGKTTLGLTILIVFISGALVSVIDYFFKIWGGLIAFLVMVIIYHEVFRLKWWKSLIVWLVQFIIILLVLFILNLLGLSFQIALSPKWPF